MYKVVICIFLVVVFTTCAKVMCGCDPVPPAFYKTTVVETSDNNCSKPLLLFEDSVAICTYTGLSNTSYVTDQLPDSLRIVGKKVKVVVSRLQPGEDFSCTGTGPSYPHLKVH